MKTFLKMLSFSIALLPTGTWAKNNHNNHQAKIVATVGNSVITAHDLMNRFKLVAGTSGMKNDEATRRNLLPQILDNLIDEKLQIETAENAKIKIGDEAVNNSFVNIASENGMTADQFTALLKQKGSDVSSLKLRLKAQLAWVTFIKAAHPSITVTPKEVDHELKNITDSKDKTQYLISELYVRADTKNDLTKVNSLVSQLRSTGNFEEAARHLGQGGARPHMLGWLSPEQMPQDWQNAVKNMKPGSISSPIQRGGGFSILHLHEVRHAGQGDPQDATVTYRQVMVPWSDDLPEDQKQMLYNFIQNIAKSDTDKKFISLVKEMGGQAELSSATKIRHLPPGIREVVESLKVGKCSEPARTPQGILVVRLCSYEKAKFEIPTKEEIEQQLANRVMERIAGAEMTKIRGRTHVTKRDIADLVKNGL